VPPASEIDKAARILNGGEKIAILVGAGALKAREELIALAEITGGGIAKALLGKAAVEDSLPYVTGCIGLLGTEASSQLMKHCDTLLMVGSNFPYSEYLPKPGSVKAIQIDLDPANISLRYPMDVGLIGDSAATLKLLLPLLRQKADNNWRQQVEKWVVDSENDLKAQAVAEANPVNPERVFVELSKRLPEDAIITCDSGTSTVWYARHLKMRPGMAASVSGALASMGCSMPYAVAAKFAFPERPVFCCIGDGAMQMAGINELITVAKYWREWTNPRLVIIVLKNNDLSFVTAEMRATEGEPRFADSQDVPEFGYAFYARSLGLEGYKLDSPDLIESTLSSALLADRPVVVEVVADANVAPLPPSISFGEAVNFAQAIGKEGDATPIVETLKMAWARLSGK